ncbi:hypothetical protein ACFC3O_00575 [Streptomyces sp. NPDC056007]
MTGQRERIALDDLTSDQLDALYDERDRLAAEVARLTAERAATT